MKTLKYSRQREAIKEFLSTRTDHPSADLIYEKLRTANPHISLGTIYRNLSLLQNIGDIIKITTDSGADRYDGNTFPHNHFCCKKCHKIVDLYMENIDYIKDAASKNFNGSIDSYVTIFYGICDECSNL